MAFGISDPIAGYAVFAGVKLAGYFLAARAINGHFSVYPHPLKVGLARLAIGMLFGVGVWAVSAMLASLTSPVFLAAAYVLLLFPVRLLEWHILLVWFYELPYRKGPKARLLLMCVLWSYVLDFPAVFGAIQTAGAWIC